MPTVTPLIKVNRTKSYGAEVILHGDVYDDACAYALKLAEENGYTFVHPFDDLDSRNRTGNVLQWRLYRNFLQLIIFLVPIGGGGLVTGVSTLAKMLNPKIKVIGVEPDSSSKYDCGILNAGEPVTLDSADTIADGTAVKRVGEKIFPYAKENIDEILLVEDDELIGAFP